MNKRIVCVCVCVCVRVCERERVNEGEEQNGGAGKIKAIAGSCIVKARVERNCEGGARVNIGPNIYLWSYMM